MQGPDTRYDTAIRATNDDASLSKLAAVRLGYWADPWLGHFLNTPVLAAAAPPRPGGGLGPPPRRHGAHSTRRPPLINRGYFCRYLAFKWLVDAFMDAVPADSPSNIIALGAGFDTTFFRLADAATAGEPGTRLPTRYVELDFIDVTRRKATAIGAVPDLLAAVGGGGEGWSDSPPHVDPAAGTATGASYRLRPVDLRDAESVLATLDAAGVHPAHPTLILAECVLAYLPPDAGSALLAALGARFRADAAAAVYDPIRPDDAFGRQMAANLEARGCPLVGVPGAPNPDDQAARFTAGGAWGRAAAADLREVWARRTPASAHAAADALERLDEMEEWHLILEHYGLAVGVNDGGGSGVLRGFGLPPLVAGRGAGGGVTTAAAAAWAAKAGRMKA